MESEGLLTKTYILPANDKLVVLGNVSEHRAAASTAMQVQHILKHTTHTHLT